jgi:hypothetical protein
MTRPKDSNDAHDLSKEIRSDTSYDPLANVRNEVPTFNKAWFKNGESMPLVQRVGFTIFSLMSCLVGAWLINGSVIEFREHDVIGVFFVIGSVIFLIPGILGLRNVLRFRSKELSD